MVRTSDEDMASEEHVRTCCEARSLVLVKCRIEEIFIFFPLHITIV